jgi:hypothetical protein
MSPRKRPKRKLDLGQVARNLFLTAVVISISTACQLPLPSQGLSSNKLISLDPIDAYTANTDMLALYTSHSRSKVSLRIDLLDFSIDNAPSFTILLDTFPGHSLKPPESFTDENRWEVRLHVAPDLSVAVTGEDIDRFHEQVSVRYDHELDIVLLELPREITQLPGPFGLALASHGPDTSTIADTIGPVQSDSRSPQPIPILLSFSNVFPSATPAQAMRSWDGAHNGPAGERFGLRHLLEAVELYKVPVVLTDLKLPGSLTGLQILGADSWIQELEAQRLLSLPEALPYSLCEQAAALAWPVEILDRIEAETIARGYSHASELTCFQTTEISDHLRLPSGFRTLILTPDGFESRQVDHGHTQDPSFIYAIHGSPATSLSSDGGLAIDLRRQITAQLDPSSTENVVLISADFQRSFWGDPHSAAASLRWIAAHPWIHPITLERYGTLNLPIRSPELESGDLRSAANDSSFIYQPIALQEALPYLKYPSSSGLRSLAWHLLYASHTIPNCREQTNKLSSSEDMLSDCDVIQQDLRKNLQHLSAVQEWELTRNTIQISDQAQILEYDGEDNTASLLYASPDWLTILSRDSHNLDAIFTFHPQRGSIPLLWSPAKNMQDSHTTSNLNISVRSMTNQLEIEFRDASPEAKLDLPIFLPPNLLTHQKTCISFDIETEGITIGCTGEFQVRMDIQHASWSFNSILDSPGRWTVVEDPNLEMPPGHFMPIPFGLLSVDFDDHFTILWRVVEESAE